MSDWEKDQLDLELELLQASYGPELEITTSPSGRELKFHATPYVGAQKNRVFVSIVARIKVSSAYPNEDAKFELSEPRGLDDEQIGRLGKSLSNKVSEAVQYGELHIAQGLQVVSDFLTSENRPNPCPVCFDIVDSEAAGDDAMLGLNPCLHCLHASCYEGYRDHLMQRKKEKVALLVHREGLIKAARLAEIKWATCPVCRMEFDIVTADRQLSNIRKTT